MTGYYHLPTWQHIVWTINHVECVNDILVGHLTLSVLFCLKNLCPYLTIFFKNNIRGEVN